MKSKIAILKHLHGNALKKICKLRVTKVIKRAAPEKEILLTSPFLGKHYFEIRKKNKQSIPLCVHAINFKKSKQFHLLFCFKCKIGKVPNTY